MDVEGIKVNLNDILHSKGGGFRESFEANYKKLFHKKSDRKKVLKVKAAGRPRGNGKITKNIINEARKLLKEGASHGVSIKDVAKTLGVTYSALWSHGIRAKEYGCRPGRRSVMTVEMSRRAVALQFKGYSTSVIAKHLGVSKSSVYRVLW